MMEKLPDRLKILMTFVRPSFKLADVGCDHGYIAKAVLDEKLCENVVVSDISEKSLNKAINLLRPYIGKQAKAVVCDGLEKIDDDVDQVLIAGMGGEEIVKILSCSRFLPKRLVLQPMKNPEKVRKLLIEKGYGIEQDTIIFDGSKFYFVITADLNAKKTAYTQKELLFGKDNLNGNQTFLDYLDDKIARLSVRGDLKNAELNEKIEELKELKNEIKRNF